MDEAPQVVVLREGKHLTAHEVENERRKGTVHSTARSRKLIWLRSLAKGLPPLPDPDDKESPEPKLPAAAEPKQAAGSKQHHAEGLSFSSGSSAKPAKKRRIINSEDTKEDEKKVKPPKKKVKKADKKLLSFDL